MNLDQLRGGMVVPTDSRCKHSYDRTLRPIARPSLDCLPVELQEYIFSFLRKNDLVQASLTCRNLQGPAVHVRVLENKEDYKKVKERLRFLIERVPEVLQGTLNFEPKVFFGPLNQNEETGILEKSPAEQVYELHQQHESLKDSIKIVLKAVLPFSDDEVNSLTEDILQSISSDETYIAIFNALMECLEREVNQTKEEVADFYSSEDCINMILEIAYYIQDPAQKSNALVVAYNLMEEENLVENQGVIDEALAAAKNITDDGIKSCELKSIYEAYLNLNNLESAFDAVKSMPSNGVKSASLRDLFKCSIKANNLDLAAGIAREFLSVVKKFFALAKICELTIAINVGESIALANEALAILAEDGFALEVQSLIPRKKYIEVKVADIRSRLQAIISL